jgi:hypothetical protein
VLIALALDAADSTRQEKPGEELLALRGNCSTRTVRRTIDRLAAQGFVKAVGHPGPGVRAVYAILPMPGTPANDVSDDTPDNDVADDDATPANDVSGDTPANDVSGDDAEHRPLSTPPSPANDVSAPKQTTDLPTPTVSARDLLAAFIDWDRARGGQLTKRTIGQLATHIDGLLREGITEEHIKRGLIEWRDRGQHPSSLHSFVDAAMNGRPGRSRREGERQAKWAGQLERARAADAAEAAGRGELT